MYQYKAVRTHEDLDERTALLEQLRTKLPSLMRRQLNLHTQSRAYFLLTMLSDDPCVHQLRDSLQEQYPAHPNPKSPVEQALQLVSQLQESSCDHNAPFKYRLPSFLSEYPIHSREINSKINQFNRLIEAYHADPLVNRLDASELNMAYQAILTAIAKHHMGCTIHSLWQLLKAMSAWSTRPVEDFLQAYPCLLFPVAISNKSAQIEPAPLSTQPVQEVGQPISANKQADSQAFTANFNYKLDETGRIEQTDYLLLNGFALKPGGHADALSKKIPDFLPWVQWQSNIRRQLSQLIELPLNDEFFDWLQTVLQRLGIEFVTLQKSSYKSYVSPFLNHKTTLNALNEEMVLRILQEQCDQAEMHIDAPYLPIISRYLIRVLQGFQFNRGQALGIGANWGGVVSDSNEAGADAFRFNDPEWAALFRQLSIHRQGPAEARMNAAIGAKYEIAALLSSFEYMTQLQASEYAGTLYNALVDNLVTGLLPEPPYFENEAYTKYRRHYAMSYTDDGVQEINFFYLPDPQGTYYKTKKGDYKQTPMFRQAGSLVVEPFPRDTGSGDCSASLSVANPLWPLQLQYAQSCTSSIRGHEVYNPTGPDEFIPDSFYGQIIRESDEVFVPFIGVVPKNFDGHFKQVELCASFVVRMLHSARLMTYCPAFKAYYSAILTRFLPPIAAVIPPLPNQNNATIKRKWRALDQALHDPERTAERCNAVFMSLFKELIYSLYTLTKEDADLHYYFVELTNSPDALKPQNRTTCERLIREITTLKPLLTPGNRKNREQYDRILNYLSELTGFFYPKPCDETAEAIAEQAQLHVKSLLELPHIKSYFADLSRHSQANISPKVSPGLMHDAIKYQGPSPDVSRDFYRQRHETNFPSGYRDIDGSQIVRPSRRETFLDKTIKTVGAILPLFHRNKSFFSVITQPLSQAYIAGNQTYRTQKQNKLAWTVFSGIRGFIYGAGLGAGQALQSIPKSIYNAWFAKAAQQQKSDHALAISSAPSNEPGLRVEALMDIRDRLLKLMATANSHQPSSEELITLLLTHVKKLHPSLLSGQLTTEERYRSVLLETFPLEPFEWQQLFAPVIRVGNNKGLEQIIKQYALQIDRVLIYALYECLTDPKCNQAPKKIISTVIEKHKLKDPQDKALAALVYYYASNPEAKKEDIDQYRFHGSAIVTLKEKERSLRKLQLWLNNALDSQWSLESLLTRFVNQYRILLNGDTLAVIVSHVPDSIKEVLDELLSKPGNDQQVLSNFDLNGLQRAFILQCAGCYRAMISKEEQAKVLEQIRKSEHSDSSLSIKAREHFKLTQFIRREWRHQFLTKEAVQPIIDELIKQASPAYHLAIEQLARLYKLGVQGSSNPNAFDAFYFEAIKIQRQCSIESPLREWVNVTMNVFVNCLLDEAQWTKAKTVPNPLRESLPVIDWLKHLMRHKDGVRSLLAQQIEQAHSFDHAAWRCQHLLRVLEESQPNPEYIRKTGMQKLLRIICQNTNTISATGDQQAKEVPIAALCQHSITMQRALGRVKEKIPDHDFVRAVDVAFRT